MDNKIRKPISYPTVTISDYSLVGSGTTVNGLEIGNTYVISTYGVTTCTGIDKEFIGSGEQYSSNLSYVVIGKATDVKVTNSNRMYVYLVR